MLIWKKKFKNIPGGKLWKLILKILLKSYSNIICQIMLLPHNPESYHNNPEKNSSQMYDWDAFRGNRQRWVRAPDFLHLLLLSH